MGTRRAVSVLFAVALLAACAQTSPDQPEEPDQSEQPEQGEGASQPPASEPTEPSDPSADTAAVSSVAVPPCESLLTPSDLKDYFIEGHETVEFIPTPENWGPPAEHMIDEETRYLMERADDPVSCTWGMPSTDNFFTIIIAPLDESVAGQLEEEIAAQGYTEMRPPTPGYSFNVEDSAATGVHIVQDDVWFLFQGGPGSIHADDAERHRFATMLSAVVDKTLP